MDAKQETYGISIRIAPGFVGCVTIIEPTRFDGRLETLQNAVKGFIETVSRCKPSSDAVLVINEERRMLPSYANYIATELCRLEGSKEPFSIIVGDAILCKKSSEDIVGFSEDETKSIITSVRKVADGHLIPTLLYPFDYIGRFTDHPVNANHPGGTRYA